MGQILHGSARRRTVGASHVAGRRGWSHLWPAVVIIVVVLLAFYQLAADVYSVSVLRDTLIFGLFAPVFDLIRGYRHDAAAVLCAFDLLELDGEDLRRTPVEKRKRILAKLLKSSP